MQIAWRGCGQIARSLGKYVSDPGSASNNDDIKQVIIIWRTWTSPRIKPKNWRQTEQNGVKVWPNVPIWMSDEQMSTVRHYYYYCCCCCCCCYYYYNMLQFLSLQVRPQKFNLWELLQQVFTHWSPNQQHQSTEGYNLFIYLFIKLIYYYCYYNMLSVNWPSSAVCTTMTSDRGPSPAAV